jgi:hypothetical protein
MATATKRKVVRDAQQRVKKDLAKKGKIKGIKASKSTEKEGKAVVSVDVLKSDPKIIAAFKEYDTDERAAGSMIKLMNRLVSIWASNEAYGTDKAHMQFLIDREREIRTAVRREYVGVLTERDKKGVAASQFVGVLKLAKLGGEKMWKRGVDRAHNWTNAKELATAVNQFAKKNNNAMPDNKWLDKKLAAIKRGKKGGRKTKTRRVPRRAIAVP